MKPLILVVEDDAALTELIRYNLESAGYETIHAADGNSGLIAAEEKLPALVVLDWMLPGLSGIEVCRRLRAQPEGRDAPIIMLTARGEEDDRVKGLDAGADDYMVKPFSPKELLARVRAQLRRAGLGGGEEALTYEDLTLDPLSHRVSRDGRSVHLGPTEFRLLRVLMERPGRVFSRDELLDRVWGRDIHVEDRTVDVHVRRLRKVLNEGGARDLIRTVRAAGYALDSDRG